MPAGFAARWSLMAAFALCSADSNGAGNSGYTA